MQTWKYEKLIERVIKQLSFLFSEISLDFGKLVTRTCTRIIFNVQNENSVTNRVILLKKSGFFWIPGAKPPVLMKVGYDDSKLA